MIRLNSAILKRLTDAFREKNYASIVKNSADIGHYVADAHVPLHASENHNGQLTDQKGIHAFWESRIPELLADKHFDFFVGKAVFINDPGSFIWKTVMESSKAADSVLRLEKELSLKFSPAAKYSFESKNNIFTRNYSPSYTVAFDKLLDGMVERRMRQSIVAVASFWYTAWVNAGQPDLSSLTNHTFSADEKAEFDSMNAAWKNNKVQDLRSHE